MRLDSEYDKKNNELREQKNSQQRLCLLSSVLFYKKLPETREARWF